MVPSRRQQSVVAEELAALRLARKCEAIAMYRGAFLKAAAGEQRPAAGALPLPHLPRFIDAAAAQTGAKRERLRGDAHRSGATQNASRFGEPSVEQSPPSALGVMADPGDLVARALAILADEDETWQARQGANLARRSIR
jgi:hypothetical protein